MHKRNLLLLAFLLNSFLLSANEIYSLSVDEQGRIQPGSFILSIPETENPASVLADYLGYSTSASRTEGVTTFISSKKGYGFIPVLAFHKLGSKDKFELTPQKFEELLIFLLEENYHIISDKQLINSDFTYAPDGKKLIVLGADDGAAGVFYYETSGDIKTSPFIMEDGQYLISNQSMVYYLDKHLPRERGRGNFTFYMTFDAIPFRQTGGGYNPGPPYLAMPAVRSKLHYIDENYYIGNHTLHHYYSEDITELEFLFELIGCFEVLESYGIDNGPESTLSYSYGIGELSPQREQTVREFSYKGITLLGAFDYDGHFTKPVESYGVNTYDISRTGVDNSNYENILMLLEAGDIYINQRAVLVDGTEYPFNLSGLELNKGDRNFILIRN